jgi:hypothetical protein
MPNKGTTDPEPKHAWYLSLFRGRLFRWCIAFWVLLWILSGVIGQTLVVNLKGCYGMRFGFVCGSVGVNFNTYGTGAFNYIQWDAPMFIWSEIDLSHLQKYPKDLIGLLGSIGWSGHGSSHSLTFPIAGFLFIWLIGGWLSDFKATRRDEFLLNGLMMKRATILLVLLLTILYSDHQHRIMSDCSECILQARNIQQTIRGYEGMRQWRTGDPIPWDDMFDPSSHILEPYMKECPSGGNYQLIPTVPDIGVLAAECPNPEHQRRIKDQDTSGW